MERDADPLQELIEHELIEHGNMLSGRRSIRTPQDYDANYRASFARLDNWNLVAQVQLVHVDGNLHTLVGLFDEFTHCRVPRCRRLVASTQRREGLCQKSEEVHGDHWLPTERMTYKRQPTERKLQVCCNLDLSMGQHLTAAAVALEAHLVGGGLQRLLLLADTIFEGFSPRTILSLPQGLDVLEGLSHTCKEAVWRSVGEELGA